MKQLSQIKKLIEMGNILEALDNVIHILQYLYDNNLEKRLLDQAILIKSAYLEAEKSFAKGLIKFEDSEKTKNHAKFSILGITNDLAELLKDGYEEDLNITKSIYSNEELIIYYKEEKIFNPGFKGLNLLPCVLIFDNTQRKLPISTFSIIVDENQPKYSIPYFIKNKANQLSDYQISKNDRLFNSNTIRLNDILDHDREVQFLVSKATYLDYLGTNYSLDIKFEGWSKTLREIVHPENRLCPLNKSLLSNHIGIGVLAFTSDGFLILQNRSSKNVSIYGDLLAPSISGATEYKDIYLASSNPVTSLIFREAEEELGIDEDDFISNSIHFLGVVRELARGGKPEMFFSANLNIDSSEIKKKFKFAKDRKESNDLKLVECEPYFMQDPLTQNYESSHLMFLDSVLHLYAGKISPPLSFNLALWLNYRLIQ